MDSIQNHLLVAAQRASTYLTVEELDLFHTAEDMDRPEWEEIRAKLQQFAEESAVLYVYYWRYDGGDYIQYIIDNDEDEEYMVTPELFFALDSDEISGEAALKIDAGESWVTELGVYTESWDGLLTAVVPVFNDDGTVYCGAGVDVSDEILIAMRRNIKIMEFVLIISLLISILSGFFGIRSYNKKAIQSANDSLSKSRFLSNMSHEIRTPMNAILGIAEIQLQDNKHRDETVQAFRRIYESGDLLLNLINGILDLSKVEAGKLELIPVQYELPSLVNDAAQLNRLWFNSKPIDFIVNLDKDAPYKLFGDELRIKQILNNILSNAFKYTREGKVEFSVTAVTAETKEQDSAELVFTIRDTGQGMTGEQIKTLFEDYSRFNEEVNRAVVGAGLGMSITKQLVELMNGVIIVDSQPGRGTEFIVRIPQKRIGDEVCGVKISEELRSSDFRGTPITKKTQFLREHMPYGSVLIVDDVESNIYVARGMIQPYGAAIDTANNGADAIAKVKNGGSYDIIFMDHMMPVMNGIEATKLLRESGYERTIIALTANALAGQEEVFLQNGFDGFISKPIDSRELNSIMNKFIRDRKPPEEKGVSTIVESAVKPAKVSDALAKAVVMDMECALVVLEDVLNKIGQNQASDEDIQEFTTSAHGMKSALLNINEAELSKDALALERAGDGGDFALISEKTPVFISKLKFLIDKYK
ncbi:MAG: ATP-binding protein [Oscillospiraceae bacterium]|nr:ATP-binding protein [Oscillospiraceae bacterium]